MNKFGNSYAEIGYSVNRILVYAYINYLQNKHSSLISMVQLHVIG